MTNPEAETLTAKPLLFHPFQASTFESHYEFRRLSVKMLKAETLRVALH